MSAGAEGPQLVTLTIDVDPQAFFNEAVALAVEQMLHEWRSHNEDGDQSRFANSFQRAVREEIDKSLRESVLVHVEQVVRDMLAKPLPKVDTWGDIDRSGGTQTLAEKIGEEIRSQVVDRARNHDRHGSRANASVLHQVINESVSAMVKGELEDEVSKARVEIRERVKGKVTALLEAETLRAAGLPR